MHFTVRGALIAMTATAACLGAGAARAGDDGAAPLWEGLGSIVSPLLGFGKEESPRIDYQEHGKIVVPKSMDLPAPGGSVQAVGGQWPVDQETMRKNLAKEKAKKEVAGVGDARLRYTHPFPNAPVTVRASDQSDEAAAAQLKAGAVESSTTLGNFNPLGWVGIGKSTKLGPEPDREWLTDPPKGYRAPEAAGVAPLQAAVAPQQQQAQTGAQSR
jgi:hypothetical protein